MAAAMTEILDKIGHKSESRYADLTDENHREFLRGMAWATALVRGYEISFPDSGDPVLNDRLADYRELYQKAIVTKLIDDCDDMLKAMIDEETKQGKS